MAFLTLVIGILNVCLGYALAVHLGYGPGRQPEPWDATPAEAPSHEGALAFDLEGTMDNPIDDPIVGPVDAPSAPSEEAAAGSLAP